jgi:glycosyltransferase involved in cell wall biosynthesis
VSTRQSAGAKVSVVLCGYNQAVYVKHAIESVLSQTHPHVELIIVDNGSTDTSQELLKGYEGEPRVRLLLHAINAPVTKRLNEAIALASGDYVSILYADDYYLPHKLERQVDEFSRLPADVGVVYSPAYRLDAINGNRWVDQCMKRSGFIFRDMLLRAAREGFINPISPLIRRECFARYPYHEDVFAEGETIFLRFALTYGFHYMDEPLAVMREHGSNLGKAIKINAAIGLTLIDKLSRERDFPLHLTADLKAYRASFIGSCGWLGIRMAADPRWARACLLSAIRTQPSHLLRPRTLAGLALSALPASGVRVFNKALNAMRAHRETIAYRPDYS